MLSAWRHSHAASTAQIQSWNCMSFHCNRTCQSATCHLLWLKILGAGFCKCSKGFLEGNEAKIKTWLMCLSQNGQGEQSEFKSLFICMFSLNRWLFGRSCPKGLFWLPISSENTYNICRQYWHFRSFICHLCLRKNLGWKKRRTSSLR